MQSEKKPTDRPHFMRLIAGVMRRVLVDFARRRKADKGPGSKPPLELNEELDGARTMELDLVVDLDRLLDDLEDLDARRFAIAELRWFGGASSKEIAAALDLSVSTIDNELRGARAWFRARYQGRPR